MAARLRRAGGHIVGGGDWRMVAAKWGGLAGAALGLPCARAQSARGRSVLPKEALSSLAVAKPSLKCISHTH